MIKKLSLLSFVLLGTLGAMAQSINHAGDLKKEALQLSGEVMKGVKSGDKAYTVTEKKIGDANVKITKKDGKVVRVGKQHLVGDQMHVTIYFYKNESLIMTVYNSAKKGSDKKIANFRYFDEKGKCQSSVCQDGINGDNSTKETTENSKDAKTRLKESVKYMEYAKNGDLTKIAALSLLEF